MYLQDCCDEEEDLLKILHKGQLSEPAKEDLDHLDSYFERAQVTVVNPTPTSQNFFDSDMDISLDGIGWLSDSSDDEMHLNDTETSLPCEINEQHHLPSAAQQLGFNQYKPPPEICRHPEPATGRDDDQQILKEILRKNMKKLNHTPTTPGKILFGPDHKIGNNLFKLIAADPQFSVYLPEFPVLHLRKSRINNIISGYKEAGILHMLMYMRDEETQDWEKLISANHIEKETSYIRRLAIALHVAFMARFMATLDDTKRADMLSNLLSGDISIVTVEWEQCYEKFLNQGRTQNATFALHYDLMQHCDEVVAIALAERLGGTQGYSLLLAAVKHSLPFAFVNGAISYAPFCTQLLHAHYKCGPFYQNMKASLFSTPHKGGSINFGMDTQRELDHLDVVKFFRSGSTMNSVLPKMSIIDDLTTTVDQASLGITKTDEQLLGCCDRNRLYLYSAWGRNDFPPGRNFQ